MNGFGKYCTIIISKVVKLKQAVKRYEKSQNSFDYDTRFSHRIVEKMKEAKYENHKLTAWVQEPIC